MNYSFQNVPDSGKNPTVWMDIVIQEQVIGRIHIKLFRDVFPAGVENFLHLAQGDTIRSEYKGSGDNKFVREVVRKYEGGKFFNFLHNNYLINGDIYNNDGSRAGTIYNDQPIPPVFGNYFYQHNMKGLISLVPFQEAGTGRLFYDSTFMITLDGSKTNNIMSELDKDQIVIGQIYEGLEVIDKINELILPYAGRRYPDIRIGQTGTSLSVIPSKLQHNKRNKSNRANGSSRVNKSKLEPIYMR